MPTGEGTFCGPGDPNISSFFYRASGGKLAFVEAGVLSFNVPCLATAADGAYVVGLQQAATSSVNFRSFDRNRDGIISSDELSVIVIDNLTQALAQTSTTTVRVSDRSGSLVLSPKITIIGYQSQFYNFTHELAHHIEQFDAYGALFWCLGKNLTLAGCTAFAPLGGLNFAQEFVSVYPDSFHRMFWGWTRPLVVNMRGSGGCYRLTAVPHRESNPIILYDPLQWGSGGGDEYYLVELRNQAQTDFASVPLTNLAGAPAGTAAGYDSSFSVGTGSATNVGALLWWIKNDPRGANFGPWGRTIVIVPGPTGVLNSTTARGDTTLFSAPTGTPPTTTRLAIYPGRDNVITSTLNSNDSTFDDPSLISTADPQGTLPRRPAPPVLPWGGPTRPATLANPLPPVLLNNMAPGTRQEMRWFNGSIAPMTVRAGPVYTLSGGEGADITTHIDLEWGVMPIEISSVGLRAQRGLPLGVSGYFGASNFFGAGTGRRVELTLLGGVRTPLNIRSWRCDTLWVDIPNNLSPGNYELRVVGDRDETTATALVSVE